MKRRYPRKDYSWVAVPRSEDTLAQFGESYYKATPEQRAAREEARFFGRGKYGIRRTLGKWAKKQKFGNLAGDIIHQSVANAMYGGGMYTGMGQYQGSNNLIADTGTMGGVPSFLSADDETGALTISHKEYVRDVYANPMLTATIPEDFQNMGLELNPGLEATFPWLSQVAQNFEEYTFSQLIFTYRSTIADVNSSNGQVGTVIMTTNYNANEPIFSNKSQMMGYAHSSSQKTVDHMLHGVECDPTKLSGDTGKYVRSQGLDPNQDIKTYDWGKFQLAIANTPAALADNTIGELWVSYTVHLRKPKYFTKEGYGISKDIFLSNNTNLGSVYDASTQGIMRNGLLTGIHNSIGCRLEEIQNTTTDQNGNYVWGAGYGTIKITFPAHYAGNLQILLRLASTGNNFSGVESDPIFQSTLGGNVSYVYDVVGHGSALAEKQPGDAHQIAANYWCNDNDIQIYVVHVRVEIASNSIDNTIQLAHNFEGSVSSPFSMSCCYVEIAEYNSTFGDNVSATPVFKNESGRIVELIG